RLILLPSFAGISLHKNLDLTVGAQAGYDTGNRCREGSGRLGLRRGSESQMQQAGGECDVLHWSIPNGSPKKSVKNVKAAPRCFRVMRGRIRSGRSPAGSGKR